MDILRDRSILLVRSGGLAAPQQGETGLDVSVGRVKLCSAGIGIKGVRSLIVARLVLKRLSGL